MVQSLPISGVHHVRLTVTDIARSRAFYMQLFGFDVAVEMPPASDPSYDAANAILFGGVVLVKGALVLGLRPVASADDRFDEDRVGLDHLSFALASPAELDAAVQILDAQGIAHSEITHLPSIGIQIVDFRDPDNIQLELTAPAQ